jgi:hypothetical protein
MVVRLGAGQLECVYKTGERNSIVLLRLKAQTAWASDVCLVVLDQWRSRTEYLSVGWFAVILVRYLDVLDLSLDG